MKSENWEKVETIFHQALSFTGVERQKFIEQTCSADFALFNEVQSLVTSFENENEFLENPITDLSLNVIGQKTEKTRTNTTLGFYEIGEKLGSGGMGEVYQAVDTRLNRKVALKFLPESLKNDNAAKRQLQKEAQAIAMLEHPNICAVHGIEQFENDNFIVMQFVEGVTLEKKLKTMEECPDTFKSLAKQIISAIALAHSHGVIHRDLKPGNIMLSDNGNIKVLDFGLAKVIERQKNPGIEVSRNSSRISNNGLVIGTVSYMSPEQLRGEKLDYQTDIFSLGIILYELLTSENPFQRGTQAETIAAILSENPFSAEKITSKIPPGFVNLIKKCLAKDKNKRFQSAAEILVELDKIESEDLRQLQFKKTPGIIFKIALAVFVLLIIFSMLFLLSNNRPPTTLAVLPISFESPPPEKEYLADGLTKSVIDKLSNLSDVKVKSESLVARYKGNNIEPQTVGKELNADAVFVGSIVKRDDGLFFATKIVRTSDGIFLDSNEVKLDESNLIETQENVVSRVLSKIKSRLTDEDKNKLAKKDTESTDAVNLYLKGRSLLKTRKNSDDVNKAIQFFTEAKDLDQNYAKAWAGLAEAYLSQSGLGIKNSIPPQQAAKLAKVAAKKALDLDNTLSDSYNSLGLIGLKYDWNWNEAEGYFRTAISLDPEFLPPRAGLISVLSFQQRFDEALEEANKLKEIEPLSIVPDIQIAQIHYKKYDFEQEERYLSDMQQRFHENKMVKYLLAYLFLKTNRFKEAVEILEPMYKSEKAEDKIYTAAPLGFGYAKMERRKDALKVIEDLEKLGKINYVPAQEKALIYVGLGDYDKVFEFLNKSCDERYSNLPGWISDPIVDEVWSDPRFAKIKQCVNL